MQKVLVFSFSALLCSVSLSSHAELFTEDGYRQEHYRSPTPEEHEFAHILSANELALFLQTIPRPVLIDVYRNPWRHEQFSNPEEHYNIPNSLWLANCGDGIISKDWNNYCKNNLAKATNDQKDYPVVFYCRSDCWLGWNAIKRAKEFGYSNIYWLRNGIDEWEQSGYPLTPASAVAFSKNKYPTQ